MRKILFHQNQNNSYASVHYLFQILVELLNDLYILEHILMINILIVSLE